MGNLVLDWENPIYQHYKLLVLWLYVRERERVMNIQLF